MSDQESQEKTVEQTDELLQKSRRLIDELEFILEKLPRLSQRYPKHDRPRGDAAGETARSD
jgi:hypothetical protein